MTMINALIADGEAAMLTDTLKSARGQPIGFAHKTVLLAHISTVLAVRGPDVHQTAAVAALDRSYLPGGIHDAAAVVARVLAVTPEWIDTHYPGERDRGRTAEAVILGWSPRLSRFCGYYIVDGRATELGAGIHCWPKSADMPATEPVAPASKGVAALLTVAQVQRQALDREAKGYVTGGALILTHLKPQGILTRQLHRFADYDEVASRMPPPAPAKLDRTAIREVIGLLHV